MRWGRMCGYYKETDKTETNVQKGEEETGTGADGTKRTVRRWREGGNEERIHSVCVLAGFSKNRQTLMVQGRVLRQRRPTVKMCADVLEGL